MGVVVEFFVPGIPKPGGSKRGFMNPRNGRVIITEDCKKSKDWRASVAQVAHEAMAGRPPLTGPLRLTIRFQFPRPKGHFGSGRNSEKLKDSAPDYHTTKPDTSKVVRSTEDAMKSIVWRDDSQVVTQTATKAFDYAVGAMVRIEELGCHEEL